ncbi:hypothetical protein DWQ65_12235 [Treponema phagedenis]|uniref:Uncharacterized protein n=1 Tax=Treponema phagedenis TaxID=162 RepID=A0A0B7H1B4_TREPH|nr:hypothetical protein [Treponema phagedenis]EFW38114.1 hypothetical protein HMPREF9554_01389 [Treponema phagedenis F0421]NVP23437.1 hypothetical protein [Treponema phagedenis]QEJ95653.1 hypothetical protein FUT79_10845 [Treponema phagedenis]QEJ98578.1 hypothetical protein FUT82_11615 [Treponema phagedenis]QEK01511.1 hypothetical protein FUT84_10335 [Treponema phagedenis]
MRVSVFPHKNKKPYHKEIRPEEIYEIEQKLQDQAYVDGAIQRLALILSKQLLSLRGINYE